MVVDDSTIVRGMVARWLDAEPDITVAALAANGAQAVRRAGEGGIDVILLDIEMPVMDGVEALHRLVAAGQRARIIMASSLTTRHARISFRALAQGAADFVAKPTAMNGGSGEADRFRTELVEKVRAHGRAEAAAPGRHIRGPAVSGPASAAQGPVSSPSGTPGVIAIGGSTGGPQALFTLFADFPLARCVPVVIVQHMPPTFTAMLARHLAEVSGLPCAEGRDGTPLLPGHVHVAPGGRHMRVRREAGRLSLVLGDDPPVNFCRPAVDPLFESVAASAGAGSAAIVLTGMGADGRAGACAIRDAGGTVVVQDRETSVVWGMPGAVASAGAAHAVLPIAGLGRAMGDLLARRAVRAGTDRRQAADAS
ncbi:MAG: chemotaxis-specific protein-glutamate methyltransferase CheB [Alphaproteobacteria bacterium]|nr:chemotaxis-specific protein-glutamate methyltransferase CheB [Alphaproteobacteria bacterium]MDX5369566.1 chemotaxis-specific protein-glutamate methyltransferase CheB [Alphaproteobacteria bacterium]MDX5464220.1 chemotaxis-specific protein-glutamate methyltransferase CheB [Alphaproteobacteria bacterium]